MRYFFCFQTTRSIPMRGSSGAGETTDPNKGSWPLKFVFYAGRGAKGRDGRSKFSFAFLDS